MSPKTSMIVSSISGGKTGAEDISVAWWMERKMMAGSEEDVRGPARGYAGLCTALCTSVGDRNEIDR